jgi:hypothetical protein
LEVSLSLGAAVDHEVLKGVKVIFMEGGLPDELKEHILLRSRDLELVIASVGSNRRTVNPGSNSSIISAVHSFIGGASETSVSN